MSRAAPVELIYFGKLPSRGDFLRNVDGDGLTRRLDQWLTQALELMARDPRWKEVYDQAGACSFAFLGVRSRALVAGHLLASTDASGRRFPFVVVGKLEVDAPLAFMQRAPMALARLWLELAQRAEAAHAAADAVPLLNQLNQWRVEIETDPLAFEAGYRDFLELQTVGSLQSLLAAAEPAVDLRRALLALGLLLQPVPASGAHRLEKGLRLPLPVDPATQAYAATWWLDLVAKFLARGDFEIGLFLPRTINGHAPSLAVGFSGDAPSLLHAALDQAAAREQFVDLLAPLWVDESAEADYALRKLGSYLQQPPLSLAQARATFNEAFLGE
ncbi:type VI secretion system-associated protein TagF [Aquincola sp. S2]|uniref:Type VI secretion system-associated protein TagF n=1 Tax=Pseudaquabacterium terrae TaxID=2732868 RepID=A0ABX2ELG6_9BURK|nr:type VI secretion system-associated protein TagF [Aquabacterium terrae]NRF69451.1 type VI secretion system-associated protein TagF [Aquabacterium terrae]